MRIVSTKKLQMNMRLGKTVYSEKGLVLLKQGIVLTAPLIRKLREKKIPAVIIDDELTQDINVNNVIDHEIKVGAVRKVRDVFNQIHYGSQSKDSRYNYISKQLYFDTKDLIEKLMKNLEKNKGCLFSIVEMMSSDLALYIHSVNVAIMSIMTAKSMGLDDDTILLLGLGAILHDIGMTQEGSEPYIELNHPTLGHQMLENDPTIHSYVKNIVLMHHEYLDGTGTPAGYEGDKIGHLVRVVTICDYYDTLVRKNEAKESDMPMYKILEKVASMTLDKFDKRIYNFFKKNIALYPVGTGVILNTGEKGMVIEDNALMPTRPKVRIIYNQKDEMIKKIKNIDLMKELTIFIEDVCDIVF